MKPSVLTFRSCRVFIPMFLLSGQLVAQSALPAPIDPPPVLGWEWVDWPPNRKTGYVAGFYAGFAANGHLFDQAEKHYTRGRQHIRTPVQMDRYRVERQEYDAPEQQLDLQAIVQRIDLFYTDPDNGVIPVPAALHIIMLRERGDTQRATALLQRERRQRLGGN